MEEKMNEDSGMGAELVDIKVAPSEVKKQQGGSPRRKTSQKRRAEQDAGVINPGAKDARVGSASSSAVAVQGPQSPSR